VEDLTRHAVITGASSGIGTAAAVELARRGWRVTLIGRDQGRLDAALAAVREQAPQASTAGLTADFADFAQVRSLARQLAGQRIDLLANNAGLVAGRRVITVDGHESTMQTNHLSPFLLSILLRPQLPAGARIVNTASVAHNMGSLDPADLDRTSGIYSSWATYGASKRANVLFAAEAARRWPELLSFSFHPGVVRTRFGTAPARLFYRIMPGLATAAQGADQLVWLAEEDPARLENGAYYVSRAVTRPHRSVSPELAGRLWEASLAAVGMVG
jgi:NAD(P)-dependent dehydrogenase (short-subunit alcohol dehydrogenase family)